MQLDEHIKQLPAIFTKIPHLKRYKGFLLLNQIYFQKYIFDDLQSKKPKHEHVGYLIHEQTHFSRMKQMGMIKFGSGYIFSRKRRFEEEFLAVKAQMAYLKANKQNYDTEKTSRVLASWLYLWCVPYQEAKEKLDFVWEKI